MLFDVPSMPDYGQLSNRIARGDGGRRARRGGALQEGADGLRAVEAVEARRAGLAVAVRHRRRRGGRAGTSSARRWRKSISARVRHSRRRHRPGVSASRERDRAIALRARHARDGATCGCTTASCRSKARRCRKSLGNFITINELLATKTFGASQWHGRVIGSPCSGTHYRQPIDWTAERLLQARATLLDFARSACRASTPARCAARRCGRGAVRRSQHAERAVDHSRPRQVGASAIRKGGGAAATLEFMGLYWRRDARGAERRRGSRHGRRGKGRYAGRGAARMPARRRTSRKATASATSWPPWALRSRTRRIRRPARS